MLALFDSRKGGKTNDPPIKVPSVACSFARTLNSYIIRLDASAWIGLTGYEPPALPQPTVPFVAATLYPSCDAHSLPFLLLST